MKGQKTYISLALLISILMGVILPLALGVKDRTLIAIAFSSVWFSYAVVLLLITFLIKPSLKIKLTHQDEATVVRYELRD
jgi:uncharacterized membrane protein YjfL (UPF0719 family)